MKDIKQLDNKLPIEKIDPIAIKTLAKIQQYGSIKYPQSDGKSWQYGTMETYIGALYRHIIAWQEGDVIDKESGFSHIEHAFFNAYILLWLEKKTKE